MLDAGGRSIAGSPGSLISREPPLTVQADPDQLEQPLINLLRNAVDTSLETGGVEDEGFLHPLECLVALGKLPV